MLLDAAPKGWDGSLVVAGRKQRDHTAGPPLKQPSFSFLCVEESVWRGWLVAEAEHTLIFDGGQVEKRNEVWAIRWIKCGLSAGWLVCVAG